MAGEVVSRSSLTLAFQKKQKLEWQKLREHLHLQLQQDIQRIYTESLYCDLQLVAGGTACVRTHRSILQVRASRLFKKLCTFQSLTDNADGFQCVELHKGSAEHVKSFIRNLYSKCSVIEEEEELLQHLEGVTKAAVGSEVFSSGDSGLSPESDIYLTPETSPSDLYHFTDTEKRSDQQEEHVKTLQKTNRSYYTIVSVEDSFIEDSGAKSVDSTSILERELAEQDELFKSFESIKFKEEKQNDVKKIKKPSSLTFASSHYTKKYKRGCDIPVNNKFVPAKGNGEVTAKVNTFRKKSNQQDDRKRTKVEESCPSPEDEEFLDSPSEVQVFELECCKKTELSPDEIFTSLCSPDMDASAGGPDSGLDTSSTGCVPGGGFSSPREHTISETSGVDLTEAAIGEEMPHDEDIDVLLRKPVKSSGSSSVSSDAGTWDSTFPSAQANELQDIDINHVEQPESGKKCKPSDAGTWDSTFPSAQANELQDIDINHVEQPESGKKCKPSDAGTWDSNFPSAQANELQDIDINHVEQPESGKKCKPSDAGTWDSNFPQPESGKKCKPSDAGTWDSNFPSAQANELQDIDINHVEQPESGKKCKPSDAGTWDSNFPSAQANELQDVELSHVEQPEPAKKCDIASDTGKWDSNFPSAQAIELQDVDINHVEHPESGKMCKPSDAGTWDSTCPSAQAKDLQNVEVDINQIKEPVSAKKCNIVSDSITWDITLPSTQINSSQDLSSKSCEKELLGCEKKCNIPTGCLTWDVSLPCMEDNDLQKKNIDCKGSLVAVPVHGNKYNIPLDSLIGDVTLSSTQVNSLQDKDLDSKRCEKEVPESGKRFNIPTDSLTCNEPATQDQDVDTKIPLLQMPEPVKKLNNANVVSDESSGAQDEGVDDYLQPIRKLNEGNIDSTARSIIFAQANDLQDIEAGIETCHIQQPESRSKSEEVNSPSCQRPNGSLTSSPAKAEELNSDVETFASELQPNWTSGICTGKNNTNYFINAADLVDELEVTSLPPTRFPKQQDSEQENLATKDYHSLPEVMDSSVKPIPACAEMVKTTCDIVNKGIMDCFNIKTKYTSSEVLPVESQAESFSEDMIPFLSSHLSISEDKGADTSVPASPHMKITSLKVCGMPKRDVKILDAQDVVEEFQKEIKLTEQVEPYVAARKVSSSARKRHDSFESEDTRKKANNIMEPQNEAEQRTTLSSMSSDKESDADNEPRRPSLIRRNTFELDPDDDRLALLRQEYERRQGNLLFQSCIPQFSGHVTGSEGFRDTQSLVVLPGKQTDLAMEEVLQSSLPNISPPVTSQVLEVLDEIGNPDTVVGSRALVSDQSIVMGTPLRSPHMIPGLINHDIHTPDSLNNDGPLDNLQPPDESVVVEPPGVVDSDTEQKQKRMSSSFDNSMKPVISGALTYSDVVVEDKKSCDSPKKQKRTESTPIVSGGVCTADFVAPARSVTDSPIMARRKNESAPILSGGATIMCDEPTPEEPVVRPAVTSSPSVVSAWIVDMSDCTTKPPLEPRKRKKSDANNDSSKQSDNKVSSLGFFVDLKTSPDGGVGKKPLQKSKKEIISDNDVKESSLGRRNSGVGFFVELKEQKETHPSNREESHSEDGKSGPKNSSCGFFVNLSEDEKTKQVSQNQPKNQKSQATEDKAASDKKHALFSMFIDIGDSGQKNGSAGELAKSKVTSSHKRIESGPASLSSSCKTEDVSCNKDEAGEQKKGGFFMFIETDSPVTRRKTLPSGLRPNINRHSWNLDTTTNEGTDYLRGTIKKHHKRTHSLSVEKGSVGSPDDSKSSSSTSLAKSRLRGSSQSLHESVTSPEQVPQLEEEATMKHMSSSCHARIPLKADRVTKRALSYEGKSESDIETISEAKEPADKDMSRPPANDKLKQNETFDVPDVSVSRKEETEHKVTNRVDVDGSSVDVQVREVKSVEASFVKLSDLDKEPLKSLEDVADTSEVLPSFAAANRMTRSIPETSWIESKLLMTRSIGSGTSKSMSRLFPHLHAAPSSSTNSAGRSKSPNVPENADDNDTQVSETSDLSSMQSSMGPSGLEGSTEETDASSSYAGRSGPVSRLGEDLLRMFLEEINPDVTVEVGGRRLKAHKCILSSRCQYFAAMLSGGWVESAGNVISLQGFSYNAVHFALCHIYSGTSNIPDSISIVELATLADMLGLEGLKEVIMYTLKVKYCHFFHKPCTMCAAGVLECLPLAAAYGLDDIYRKSLRWITKYFVRIWPTKGFASLPRELIEKCYQQHVVHMTVDNILETVMCCDKLLATLPNVRWAEPVFGITSQLLEASIKFIANNFCGVLSSESFLMLGKELSWNISRLEDSLMAATDRLPPDQACLSHAHLHRILTKAQSPEPPPDMQWSPNFIELLRRIQKRVEASLVRQAPRAARCTSWSQMEVELRKKIQEAACLVLVPGEEGQRSRHSSLARRGQQSDNGNNAYCTAPRSIVSTGSRNLDIRQVKLAMTQQARRAASGGRVSTLKADTKTARPQLSNTKKQQQQQQQPPSTHHKAETIASQAKKVAAENAKAANGEGAPRPKTWPLRVLENKARSAKQKANSSSSSMGTPEKSGPLPRRAGGKTLISSSDSSRTSSPAMRRSTSSGEGSGRCRAATLGTLTRRSETPPGRETRSRKKKDADGVAISTDSLSEPQSSSSCKCSVKEVSKSCVATRPDTPSVRRKVREEVAISTDSLAESVASGDRTASARVESSASAPSRSIGVTRPDTPPVRERTKKRLGRATGEVSMSTDSLAAAEQGDRKQELGRISKSSPGSSQDTSKAGVVKGNKVSEIRSETAAMRRLTARQSTISPRDSPTFRVRSEAASSPYLGSPSLRRSLLMASKSSSSENNNSKPGTPNVTAKLEKAPAKSTPVSSTNKRTATRLQSTPSKTNVEQRKVTRQEVSRATPGKVVVNASKVNNNTVTRKTLSNGSLVNGKNKQNNNVQSKKVAVEDKPPTVGSRSGTFLKDEPTILKKPDVDNVQE